MNTYMISIYTALVVFPILSFLITLPYMIFHYRKYGSIPILRTVIIYSFVLYLLCIYFLVILPLPSIEEVKNMTTPTMQLIPFEFINDFIQNTSLVIEDFSTYVQAIKEPWFYQVAYNMLLLIPLGIYLRYYFKCSLKKTLLICFMTSLFFEITQLTGLYGIYPRAYRLFDIDDLIINTLGGIIGYSITPIVCAFLPTRENLDKKAYEKGVKVSFARRLVAFIIDTFVVILINILIIFIGTILNIDKIKSYNQIIYFLVIGIYFMIIPFITSGRTLGKSIVKIRIVNFDGTTPKLYKYIVRYSILYLVILNSPILCLDLFSIGSNMKIITLIIKADLLIKSFVICIMFAFEVLGYIFGGNKELLHDKLTKTKNVSTIQKI